MTTQKENELHDGALLTLAWLAPSGRRFGSCLCARVPCKERLLELRLGEGDARLRRVLPAAHARCRHTLIQDCSLGSTYTRSTEHAMLQRKRREAAFARIRLSVRTSGLAC